MRAWCRCGTDLTVTSSRPATEELILGLFDGMHQAEGCEVTTDPAIGLDWRSVAARRERRAMRKAGQ